jgi:glycosyltransferase involved in cell wall biosynthesis
MGRDHMHLAVVTSLQYPEGGPAATRHLALASGLASGGHQVTFLLVRQDGPPVLADPEGSIRWTRVTSGRGSSPIRWRLTAVRRLGMALDSIAASNPVDAVLLIDRDPILMEGALRVARSRGLPILHEITEYPDVVRLPGPFGTPALLGFLMRHLPSLDGVMVISRPLQDYVARWSNVPTLLLGSIVDTTVHTPLPPLEVTSAFVVGYAGSLSQEKDGVLNLLRATALAAPQLAPEVDLRVEVLGDTKSSAGRTAISESQVLGINKRITFHGQVPHNDVRSILARCHVLALPRPVSRQASGGFPTKLGEYLSTARPVLTTAVGDIPRYLRDRETCLMVAPNDVAALAKSMVEAAIGYRDAQAIGARGRELVERSFASTIQAPKVVSFIDQMRGINP